MAKKKRSRDEQKSLENAGYEIFIGVLSMLSIVNLILGWLIDDQDLSNVLWVMNGLFSILFLIDFGWRMKNAESKSRYFFRQFGWADLLASLPVRELKILRVFRLIRVYRIMHEYGARRLMRLLLKDKAGSALYAMLLIGVFVMEFGSLTILAIESQAANGNIKNASDAIWYTLVTMSTVGYGDQYPVTNAGRIVGSMIIIVGVAIFGTFTGYLANLFLGPSSAPAVDETDTARTKVAELRELIEKQQAALAELERQLPQEGAA